MITKVIHKLSNLMWENALLGTPDSLRILTYHGLIEKYEHRFLERNFITYKEFNFQLDFLTRKFKFISLQDILIKKGNFANEVAITFDDGFENNIIAAEILTKRKIPFTIFLTTNALGAKGKSIWPIDLSLLILKGRVNKIYLFDKYWYLTSDNERRIVYKEIIGILKKLKSEEKNKSFYEISGQFPENELECSIMISNVLICYL